MLSNVLYSAAHVDCNDTSAGFLYLCWPVLHPSVWGLCWREAIHHRTCDKLKPSVSKRLCFLWCAGSQALPREAARAVVLQAAQAFFQSASSLEAEEIGLGQITLGLLPHDPEVQQQGTCLQALQELQDYGLQVLPAQYNQVSLPPLLP